MLEYTINRGSTFTWDLTFPVDVQGRKLLFTATSVVKLSDADAEIKKTVDIPSGTPVLTYAYSLLKADTTIAPGTYTCNFRMVGGADDVGDSEDFQIIIHLGATQRYT